MGRAAQPARDQVRDLLWWEDGRLLGFLGIYGFRPDASSSPAWSTLTHGAAASAASCSTPRCRSVARPRRAVLLLVVPRTSPGGHEFARSYGMTYEHSEHALTLRRATRQAAREPELGPAPGDRRRHPGLSNLYVDGFTTAATSIRPPRQRALAHAADPREGDETGRHHRLSRDGARGAIYAFVVDSGWRGSGIGREVLRRVCQDQFDTGADRVDLEVEVENERALGLYTSVGFSMLATDDYYELILTAQFAGLRIPIDRGHPRQRADQRLGASRPPPCARSAR